MTGLKTKPKGANVGRKRVQPDLETWNGRVGARLTHLRERAGLDAQSVSDALKAKKHRVELSTWYAYESGRLEMPLSLIPSLAELFGCSVRSVLPRD